MAQPLILNVLSIPATAYMIAVLGPRDYGLWAVALTLTLTSSVLTNLGTRSYFVRRIAQDPASAPVAFAEHLTLRTLLGLAAGTLAVVVTVAMGYPSIVLQCTAILVLSTVLTAAYTSVSDLLQATERLPMMATTSFVSGLALTAASIAVVYMGWGPRALAMAYVIGPLISAASGLWIVRRTMFPVRLCLHLPRHVELLMQARLMGLQQIVSTVATQAENLLVPKLVSISAYGYFAAGTMLARRGEVVPDALTTAFYPVMVRNFQQGSAHGRRTVLRFVLLTAALCVVPAVGISAVARPIAELLFDENQQLCVTVMRISVWGLPLLGLWASLGYALNAEGRERDEVKFLTISAILSLLVAVPLVSWYGIIGASWSLVLRHLIAVLVRVPVFIRLVSPVRQDPAPVSAAVVS